MENFHKGSSECIPCLSQRRKILPGIVRTDFLVNRSIGSGDCTCSKSGKIFKPRRDQFFAKRRIAAKRLHGFPQREDFQRIYQQGPAAGRFGHGSETTRNDWSSDGLRLDNGHAETFVERGKGHDVARLVSLQHLVIGEPPKLSKHNSGVAQKPPLRRGKRADNVEPAGDASQRLRDAFDILVPPCPDLENHRRRRRKGLGRGNEFGANAIGNDPDVCGEISKSLTELVAHRLGDRRDDPCVPHWTNKPELTKNLPCRALQPIQRGAIVDGQNQTASRERQSKVMRIAHDVVDPPRAVPRGGQIPDSRNQSAAGKRRYLHPRAPWAWQISPDLVE